MSISAEEKNHYLREAAIVLAREGFHTDRTHAGGLRVLLDGAPLCEVTENGGITYRNEDIDEPERIDAKDKVYEIVRTTAEYMRQMETAPFLKADGLEDGYKVLADFNDIVLAGIQSKYGVQFVTWDWSFDRKGVSHGHYYTGLYSSGNYEAAKRDFATRSGLIPEQQLFREKQLIEIYPKGGAYEKTSIELISGAHALPDAVAHSGFCRGYGERRRKRRDALRRGERRDAV